MSTVKRLDELALLTLTCANILSFFRRTKIREALRTTKLLECQDCRVRFMKLEHLRLGHENISKLDPKEYPIDEIREKVRHCNLFKNYEFFVKNVEAPKDESPFEVVTVESVASTELESIEPTQNSTEPTQDSDDEPILTKIQKSSPAKQDEKLAQSSLNITPESETSPSKPVPECIEGDQKVAETPVSSENLKEIDEKVTENSSESNEQEKSEKVVNANNDKVPENLEKPEKNVENLSEKNTRESEISVSKNDQKEPQITNKTYEKTAEEKSLELIAGFSAISAIETGSGPVPVSLEEVQMAPPVIAPASEINRDSDNEEIEPPSLS